MQEVHRTILHVMCELVERRATVDESMPELRTETMTVNMGPQHPSTHGVLRLVLELDGENIVSAAPTIGFLHTGIEKTAEQKKWQQVIPLVERMDYLGAQSNSLAFCLSVEKLLGLEMPERVQWIRVLIAELQRISSHLVWLGTHGMEIGAVSVMLYCFREREQLLNLNEMLAGFRMFPSYIRIGGLREDLPRGFHEAVKEFLDKFPAKLDEYEDLLTKNQIWIEAHARASACCRARTTIGLGLVGPMARAVGHAATTCARRSRISSYETFDFNVPTRDRGRRLRALPGARRGDAAERQDLPAGARAHLADGRVRLRRLPHRAAAQGSGLHGDGSADPALPDLLAGLQRAEGRGLRAGRRAARRARASTSCRTARTGRCASSRARRRSSRARRCRR